MSKLQNASGNLKTILAAVIEGKTVQFKGAGEWVDEDYVENVLVCLHLEWRIKPDAFQEVYHKWLDDSSGQVMPQVRLAKHFWNAAMEHKNDN